MVATAREVAVNRCNARFGRLTRSDSNMQKAHRRRRLSDRKLHWRRDRVLCPDAGQYSRAEWLEKCF